MSEHADAVNALGRASSLEEAARRETRWYAKYLCVFAAGQFVLVPMAVLWHGALAGVVFGLTNALLVGGLSVYAARQRVVRRSFGLLHGSLVAAWAVAYSLTVVLSLSTFQDSVPFAAIAALGCASPLLAGAWREIRRSP